MSPEYLKELRESLPLLTFDPQMDQTVEELPLCREYLSFYQLPSVEEVKHSMGYLVTDNYRIASHYWLPEQPQATVFIFHGYFDHVGLYGHLINYLLEKNYAVIAFDFPGHGLSSGDQATIESFHHYVHVFSQLLPRAAAFPKPFHGVGQSTGGAVLLSYLLVQEFLFQPVALEEVVLLAPLIKPKKWLQTRLGYKLTHRFRNQVKRAFRENSSDADFVNFIKSKDPLQPRFISLQWVGAMNQWVHDFSILPRSRHPVTVVQGDDDNTVEWEFNNKAIEKKFLNTEIKLIEGAGHHLVNESEPLRSDVFQAMPFNRKGFEEQERDLVKESPAENARPVQKP